MIDAECYHFIRFLKVIRNAEMSAACATTKNIIIVVRKYDENDCRKLLKPFHLAHELWMQFDLLVYHPPKIKHVIHGCMDAEYWEYNMLFDLIHFGNQAYNMLFDLIHFGNLGV